MLPDHSSIDYVIYHADCIDGFGAAFSAWKCLGNLATYHPAKHGDMPPDVKGKNVALVDFSYKRSIIEHMMHDASSFVILDHHKSAEKELHGLDCAVFDMNHSGAMLAWNYFHKNEPAPFLIQMIEDADLWRFDIEATRDFVAIFYNVAYNFREYDAFLDPNKVLSTIKDGHIVREFMDQTVKKACKSACSRKLKGYNALVVNSSQFMSDIGNVLALNEECDVGVIWYFDHKSKTCRVSLRSTSDVVDVSIIAGSFGGGGHVRAAGFQWAGNIENIFDEMS